MIERLFSAQDGLLSSVGGEMGGFVARHPWALLPLTLAGFVWWRERRKRTARP